MNAKKGYVLRVIKEGGLFSVRKEEWVPCDILSKKIVTGPYSVSLLYLVKVNGHTYTTNNVMEEIQ